MRLYRFSRAVWVVGVITVGLLSSHIFAQDGKWVPPVPEKYFKDSKTEGKNPKPTHRLAPTECDDCQKIVDQLQAALDDWHAMQLNDAQAQRDKWKSTWHSGGELPAGAPTEGDVNKQMDAAMAGLGQPKDGGKAAKGKLKDNAKAPETKDSRASRDALAKEIKRLADALQDCLKKCEPTPTPTSTPTPSEKPPSKPGEEELPTSPTGDCWPSQEAKDKFYHDLKEAEDELDEDAKEATSHGMIKSAIEKIKRKKEEAAALRAAADKITKICPPTGGGGKGTGPGKGKPKKAPRVTTGGNVSFGGGPEESFCALISENKIKIDTVGTGETIGHVADLVIENLTDQPIEVAIPPMILESRSGKNQHYAVPKRETVEVPPHEKKTVPLYGVCVARNKPPVSKGVGGDLAINDCDPDAKIDRHKADLIRRVTESKYDAADKLEEDGELKDMPYRDPKKRKDIVVQWSTWADPRISEITGAPPATKDDLKKTVYKQAEEHGPVTPDKKKKLDDGIDTLWDKIELTTEKAKDLEKPPAEEETTPAMPSGTGENVSNDTPTPVPETQEKKKKVGKKKKKKWPKPIQDWVDKKNAADDAETTLWRAQIGYHVALVVYCRANSKHWRELDDVCNEARKKAMATGATQTDKDNADRVCNELKKQEDELAKDFNKTDEGKKESDKVNEAQKAADKANTEEKEAGKNIDQATKDAVNEEQKKVKGVW